MEKAMATLLRSSQYSVQRAFEANARFYARSLLEIPTRKTNSARQHLEGFGTPLQREYTRLLQVIVKKDSQTVDKKTTKAL